MALEASELVLNSDGSVYHLHVKGEHIADNVIVVGDQGRVELVSSYFDSIEVKKHNREFVTHTGTYKGKRITVMSTGIGTDNIDIVINEIDAAVNINPETKELNPSQRSLNIIRIGTCGGLQKSVPIETFIASKHAFGLDGVMNCYERIPSAFEQELVDSFLTHMGDYKNMNTPYAETASGDLLNKIGHDMAQGITTTSNGFYGPQGRVLRLPIVKPNYNDLLSSFAHKDLKIVNYEMETSTLYGLCKLLNHNSLTVCLVVANRQLKNFSKDYKPHMKRLIQTVLDRI